MRRRRGNASSVNRTLLAPSRRFRSDQFKCIEQSYEGTEAWDVPHSSNKSRILSQIFTSRCTNNFPIFVRKNLTNLSANDCNRSLRVLSISVLPCCSIRIGPVSLVDSAIGLTSFVKQFLPVSSTTSADITSLTFTYPNKGLNHRLALAPCLFGPIHV